MTLLNDFCKCFVAAASMIEQATSGMSQAQIERARAIYREQGVPYLTALEMVKGDDVVSE